MLFNIFFLLFISAKTRESFILSQRLHHIRSLRFYCCINFLLSISSTWKRNGVFDFFLLLVCFEHDMFYYCDTFETSNVESREIWRNWKYSKSWWRHWIFWDVTAKNKNKLYEWEELYLWFRVWGNKWNLCWMLEI